MVKQGGMSWNKSPKAKKGVRSNHRCSKCGRMYKQEYTKSKHEKRCIEYQNGKNYKKLKDRGKKK